MLRITTEDKSGSLTFQLEGKLAGPWVNEAEQCWRSTLEGRRPSTVRIDLAGVTSIDARGKELLIVMYGHGAELIAADCVMKAVVADIKRETPSAAGDLQKESPQKRDVRFPTL